MNPVQQAEQIVRSNARDAGKDFDALTEEEKDTLLQNALDEVIKNKPSYES